MAPAAPARDALAGHGRAPRLLGVVFLHLVVVPQIITCEAHEPADLLSGWQPSDTDVLCPAGSYLSPHSKKCEECEDGVGYTTFDNSLPSCIACKTCDSDENEKYPCNRTTNTVCNCKEGTFRKEGSPEACQKCQTECPAGKVMASPCTPRSDLKCMDKESGTKATEEAPAPGRPVTSSPRTLASPCPFIDSAHSTAFYAFVGIVIVGVLISAVVLTLWKCGLLARFLCIQALVQRLKSRFLREGWLPEDPTSSPGRHCGQDPEQGSGVLINLSGTLRRSESQDNDHNEDLNRQASQFSLAQEHEIEQHTAGATGVSEEAPGEADCLLGLAKAKRSSVRKKKLILVSGVDSIQALREIFDQIKDLNHKSWDPFMRKLGLTENEIHLIMKRNQIDPLYEMLQKWLNKEGRKASINALLDALEQVGENLIREKAEEYALESKNFIYEEHETGSAVSSE